MIIQNEFTSLKKRTLAHLLGSDFGGSNRKLSPTAISCASAMSVTPSESFSTSSTLINFGGDAKNENSNASAWHEQQLNFFKHNCKT